MSQQQQQQQIQTTQVLAYSQLIAVSLFGAFAIMQIGIAIGVVPITIVWGGSQHELTVPLRLARLLAACLLIAFAYVVQQRGSLHDPPIWIRSASWIITIYMIVNTFGNLLSSNPVERYLSGALTSVLFACCFIVSSSSPTSAPLVSTVPYTYASIDT